MDSATNCGGVLSLFIGMRSFFNVVSLFVCAGDKPHACELCNKRFALACNLRAHMKTHEGTALFFQYSFYNKTNSSGRHMARARGKFKLRASSLRWLPVTESFSSYSSHCLFTLSSLTLSRSLSQCYRWNFLASRDNDDS